MNRAFERKRFFLIMGALLLLQLACLFYYGTRKAGFHEDELYTYYSTNKTAGLFVNDRQWMEREDLRNDFVVLEGERFRYNIVKQMQSWDVHPPVYYYIFHTVCSLFPGVFSKWLGLGVNFIAYTLSFVLLAWGAWLAAGEAGAPHRGKTMAFLTCLAWGFCPAVISGVMFIRMYQWLTVFVLLCMDLHLRALKKEDFRIRSFLLPLGITVFLGFLTQYYYLIFHFFLGVGFCFLLLQKKRIRELLSYGAACVGGLLLAIFYYPASLSHIFRGYRGTEAVGEFSDLSNTGERLRFFLGLFDDYVMSGSLSWWFLAICLLGVTAGYLRKREKGAFGGINGEAAGVLIFACAGYFFTVSKTALVLGETSNRYQLPIYGILLFLILYGVWGQSAAGCRAAAKHRDLQENSLGRKCCPPWILTVLVAAAVLWMDGAGLAGDRVFFLYENEKEIMEFVRAHRQESVVVFYHEDSPDHIWWLSDELMEYPEIYLAAQGSGEPITDRKILESDRLLVYAADREMGEKQLGDLLKANPRLHSYQIAAEKGLWTLYQVE